MRWTLAVATAASIAIGASAAADGATSATSYSRFSASAAFLYIIDYGSNPDSTFNGKYTYNLTWRLRTIVAFDGKRITARSGLMLAHGTVSLKHDLTQWNGSASRTPIRCTTPGSKGGRGQEYVRDTNGGRLSGGGGVSAKFTPFPADQLTATQKRLRDGVGKNIGGAGVPVRDCS